MYCYVNLVYFRGVLELFFLKYNISVLLFSVIEIVNLGIFDLGVKIVL